MVLAQNAVVVRDHHPLGASTGCLDTGRSGNWPAVVEEALAASPFAVELAALSERELPGLVSFLSWDAELPFRFVSVHAPVKHRRMSEAELIDALVALPAWLDAIVVHPDTIEDARAYAVLGSRLVLENMDERKAIGRTAAELEPFFDVLPEAGFCFDIAHAWQIDPSMREGERMLDAFARRLRHIHISSLTAEGGHVPLTDEHERLFGPLLSRCGDVPWIFEAPLTAR